MQCLADQWRKKRNWSSQRNQKEVLDEVSQTALQSSLASAASWMLQFLRERADETFEILESIPNDVPTPDIASFEYGQVLARENPGARFAEITGKAISGTKARRGYTARNSAVHRRNRHQIVSQLYWNHQLDRWSRRHRDTPRIDASSSSTMWRTGSFRPARRRADWSCSRQPGLPDTTISPSSAATWLAFRSPSCVAASGCTRL
jgi:hypothetical protein